MKMILKIDLIIVLLLNIVPMAILQCGNEKQLIQAHTLDSASLDTYLDQLECEIKQTSDDLFLDCIGFCMNQETCIGVVIASSCQICSLSNSTQGTSLEMVNLFIDIDRFQLFIGE